MQSELKSLSKIFSETIFRIPDYQRGYSWEHKHLKDFWNDIEQLPDGKSHYTGVLTLEPVSKENYEKWEDDIWIIESKRYTPMYIVDGQQRITTTIILLQCILERIKEDEQLNFTEKNEIKKKYIYETKDKGISKSYLFGYEKDNPSYEFLKKEIFEEQSINHSVNEETIYTKNLIFSKKFFKEKIKDLSHDSLELIFTKLTQNFLFNIFFIEKELDVFVTFETMNNRGKPLSHLELLKNRLIYLSTKFNGDFSESSLLRKAINESWKSIYHYLGKIDLPKFDDDTFLHTHFLLHIGPTLEKSGSDFTSALNRHNTLHNLYKEQLLEVKFNPKRVHSAEDPLTIEDIYNYSKSMMSTVKVYHDVACPEDGTWSEVEKTYLEKINRQEDYEKFLLCVAALSTYTKGKNRENLIKSIERFGFLSKLSRNYFNHLDEIELSIAISGKEKDSTSLLKEVNDICDKYSKSQDFKDAIRKIGKEASNGYYAWKLMRYFMFEYEQELRRLSKTSRQLLGWSKGSLPEFYHADYRTIEHIYPQRVTDDYWKAKFSKYSTRERNILKNSLGNLLPVSHGKNSSLSNKSFNIKKGSEKNQIGYSYGCLSEIQVASNKDWGAIEILRRGIYLLDFMEKRWNVEIGTPMDKCQILGLEFVLETEETTIEDITTKKPKIPKPPKEEVEKRNDKQNI
ncbi:DUF262 domain-containing protein [Pseudomonas aeruginosa]|uniref:DUF262 domain-containing protein n=1 Tax=Pseudomonas aeruginosa TaxID=287 RepID=UPI0009A43863|nr:DUF262 domain-containing protein [Pseudomonas aeruginosa]HBO4150304.1 DUF262 domain-containing protein [Pseudomonas aeruginosa]HCF3100190.1 DUF262 domain-containing protein [Pseudomonas aeruginosa]